MEFCKSRFSPKIEEIRITGVQGSDQHSYGAFKDKKNYLIATENSGLDLIAENNLKKTFTSNGINFSNITHL